MTVLKLIAFAICAVASIAAAFFVCLFLPAVLCYLLPVVVIVVAWKWWRG